MTEMEEEFGIVLLRLAIPTERLHGVAYDTEKNRIEIPSCVVYIRSCRGQKFAC